MAIPLIDRDPRNPDGPGPGRPIPEPPAPTTLPGEFGKKWRQLGGDTWGTPTDPPMTAPGGGRWVQFRLRDGSLASMFSSSRTGTFVVSDRMNRAWLRAGRSSGPLGLPSSDELPAHDRVGTYQSFEGGVIVWHPQLGAFEVHGAIYQRYVALGGSQFGYPTADEGSTPDGAGRFNHFRNTATGGDASIYWTQTTGAHEVFGLIRGKWAQLGWERSPLGYPTSGELVTHDGTGRFAVFQRGVIVWHPSTGAFGTWGAVNERYAQIGGSAFGYPITDITKTPDGRGEYVHLRHIEGGDDRSIYWHPDAGAHEIYGQIRGRWAQLGWERGHLAYPTGVEQTWTERPGGRSQQFQRGALLYDPQRGAYADPMQWHQDFKSGGVSGQITVTAHRDGRVDLDGYIRSNALTGFDYLLQVMLVADGKIGAVSFTVKGSVSGTHGSDEKDNFHQSLTNPIVRTAFPAFQRGTVRLQQQHSNTLTATLRDLSLGALKWGAGELLLTPGTALIVVAATEIVSAAAGGGLVAGAQLIDGTLWLAGPSGTFFALVADAFTRLATEEKDLPEAAYRQADAVFKGTLPPRDRIKVTDALGAGGHPYTYPRFDGTIVINLGPGLNDPWNYRQFDNNQIAGQALVHELAHAWQYHHSADAVVYAAEALASKLPSGPNPGVTPDKSWSSYDQEQRAQIVDQWFGTFYNPGGTSTGFGLETSAALTDVAYRNHIGPHIRAGRP